MDENKINFKLDGWFIIFSFSFFFGGGGREEKRRGRINLKCFSNTSER